MCAGLRFKRSLELTGAQFGFNQLDKSLKGGDSINALAVDYYDRASAYPERPARFDIRVYPDGVLVLLERCCKFSLIDPESTGFGYEVLFAQRILMLENVFRELPEAAFGRRGHCRFVGQRGLWMKRKREAPKL